MNNATTATGQFYANTAAQTISLIDLALNIHAKEQAIRETQPVLSAALTLLLDLQAVRTQLKSITH